MAGIAAYGSDLAGLLSDSSPIVLTHRLESVKFLNEFAPHDPENYGHVTVEAVARNAAKHGGGVLNVKRARRAK